MMNAMQTDRTVVHQLVRKYVTLRRVQGTFGPGVVSGVLVNISGVKLELGNAWVPTVKLQSVVCNAENRTLTLKLGARVQLAHGDGFTQAPSGPSRVASTFELQVTLEKLRDRKLKGYRAVVVDLDDKPLCEGPFVEVISTPVVPEAPLVLGVPLQSPPSAGS